MTNEQKISDLNIKTNKKYIDNQSSTQNTFNFKRSSSVPNNPKITHLENDFFENDISFDRKSIYSDNNSEIVKRLNKNYNFELKNNNIEINSDENNNIQLLNHKRKNSNSIGSDKIQEEYKDKNINQINKEKEEEEKKQIIKIIEKIKLYESLYNQMVFVSKEIGFETMINYIINIINNNNSNSIIFHIVIKSKLNL